MRNHLVTSKQPLLNIDGTLREPGWSTSLVQTYNRRDIKKRVTRIKEWDYYSVISNTNNIAVCFTVSDLGYIELDSVSFLDFSVPREHTQGNILPFPLGRLHMPSDSSDGGKGLKANITLESLDDDTMVIATPFKTDKKAFYYNQKINCMRASGKVMYDGKVYELSPETDFGGLDWGRGVWTYDNIWYWGSGSGEVDGHRFGFNIGYGFGDTSAASENVIFYDGKAHKIDDVKFNIGENYTDPWTFTSSDGRFEMKFEPIIDRSDYTSALGIIVTNQHQVFGRMTGKAVLDDGTVIRIKDFLCFAEKVHNKY